MDAEALRKLQEPLKTRFRKNPSLALITLRATSRIGEGITCTVDTGRTLQKAGMHPATGGDGLTICSGDMLLEALVACAGVTLKAVATSLEFDLLDGTIMAEGDLDFRGTLSVDKSAPVGFIKIRLRFDLQTLEGEERTRTLIRLTERYCVVYQTLVTGVPIEVVHQKRT